MLNQAIVRRRTRPVGSGKVSRGRIAALAAALLLIGSISVNRGFSAAGAKPNPQSMLDPTGFISTYSTTGTIDTNNLFFQNLGTNQRTCATCHLASNAWTLTPAHVQFRFMLTGGTDPLFRTNDGSNCDTLDVSTVAARKVAYSMLLNKAVFRIALPMPAGAEFTVTANDNPYTCTSTTTLSMYRRPLPTANVSFLSTVMWDGRESFAGNTLQQNLMHQANDAYLGHSQGINSLTPDQQQQIVDFETALFTAQSLDFSAGSLSGAGGLGGPTILSTQPFYIGINDALGGDPTGKPFDPVVFTIYSAWEKLSGGRGPQAARASIGRGEVIFNTRPITISGVGGLNDAPGVPTSFVGTCTTCHDSPNIGHHSVAMALNIGVSDPSRRTPDMPLFTVTNNTTGEVVQTMDPGRALITGKWADIGKTKGPILRGLAARAPYFHNGSAPSLMDAVNFYNTRFGIGLSDQDKTDLVNFLNTL